MEEHLAVDESASLATLGSMQQQQTPQRHHLSPQQPTRQRSSDTNGASAGGVRTLSSARRLQCSATLLCNVLCFAL